MSSDGAGRTGAQGLEGLGEQTVDDIRARFEGKWILMLITEENEYHNATKGVVIAAAKRRDDIQPAALEAVERSKVTGEGYYIFKAHGYIGISENG